MLKKEEFRVRLSSLSRISLISRLELSWFDESNAALEASLNQQLAGWTKENFDAIQNSRPQMPATAHNRLGDNWRPLFSIAEIAGGDWPQLAACSFTKLGGEPLHCRVVCVVRQFRQVCEGGKRVSVKQANYG